MVIEVYLLADIIGDPNPSAIDVYRGNTELEITSVNETPIDSVVIFKKIIMKNKICTDILQSKKLTEILPLESADMYYSKHPLENYYSPIPNIGNYSAMLNQIPCWSTSALLEIIRNNGRYELQIFEGGYYFEANGFMTESYFNPVDTCYEFILKLYELNML